MSTGLVVFTTGGGFLVSGGGTATGAVTPSSIVALPQGGSGANDLPPININYDILYLQHKGFVVRDLAFNFGVQTYTGTDRSVLASHLFANHTAVDWAYAEEPHRLVSVVRDDGVLLQLTYVPEQEVFGWSRRTTNGLYISVASIPEGDANALYQIVLRTIDGDDLYYVERVASRVSDVLSDAWFLDCALQYSGAPATTVTGLDHLEGCTVNALADGMPILDLTVTGGEVEVPEPASTILVGLPYVGLLETLNLDVDGGEPGTRQGQRKLIAALTTRVTETLGLEVGQTFDRLVTIKDLQVPYTPPIAARTTDVRTIIPAAWAKPGRQCYRAALPLPATILGVIPEVTFGDTQR